MKDAEEVTEQSDAIHAADEDVAVDDDLDYLFEESDNDACAGPDSDYVTESPHSDDDDLDSLFGEGEEVNVDGSPRASVDEVNDDAEKSAPVAGDFVAAGPAAQESSKKLEQASSQSSTTSSPGQLALPKFSCSNPEPEDTPEEASARVWARIRLLEAQLAEVNAKLAEKALRSTEDQSTGQKRKRRDSVASSSSNSASSVETEAPAPKRARPTARALEVATVREQLRNGTLRKHHKVNEFREWMKRLPIPSQSTIRSWSEIEIHLRMHFDRVDAAAAAQANVIAAKQTIDLTGCDSDSDEDAEFESEDAPGVIVNPKSNASASNQRQRSNDSEHLLPAKRPRQMAPPSGYVPGSMRAMAKKSATYMGAVETEHRIVLEHGQNWQNHADNVRRLRRKDARRGAWN